MKFINYSLVVATACLASGFSAEGGDATGQHN
jgi:hypothetical protein